MALDIKLKKYRKDFQHSYSLGVYPTLELIENQPENLLAVITHSKGESNQGIHKIRELCASLDKEMISSDKLVDRLSSRSNTYAIGVFQKERQTLSQSENHLVLVNPTGMGNLGTIIRTMVGFGFKDLALIEPAADIFDPRVIRASMGSFFKIRFKGYHSFADYWGSHANHQLYTLMTDGKIALSEARFQPPYALIFGPEDSGLDKEFQTFGRSIRITHEDEIDSLNLAVSVGITLSQAYLNSNNLNDID